MNEYMENLGYTYCGLYTAIGGRQYKNVYVKHDKSGPWAVLLDMKTEEEAKELLNA